MATAADLARTEARIAELKIRPPNPASDRYLAVLLRRLAVLQKEFPAKPAAKS